MMTKPPKDKVYVTLKKLGPLPSSELAAALVSEGYAQNPASARKLIERSRKAHNIFSTLPIKFDKQALYYLEQHKKTKYCKAVIKLLEKKPSFDRVYKAALANKGYITLGQIGKTSCCLPVDWKAKTSKRPYLKEVVEQLTQLGVLKLCDGEEKLYICGDGFRKDTIKKSSFNYIIDTEQVLLKVFSDWLSRCYLVAWESKTYRKDAKSSLSFNSFHWDFTGPSYFGPFTTNSKTGKKPHYAFVVADILSYRQFKIFDANSFIEKVKTVNWLWKTTAFIPVVLAPNFSKAAFSELKKSGIICITLDDVFGKYAAKLLKSYSNIFLNPDKYPKLSDLDESLDLVSHSELSNDLLAKIKGDFFELTIAMAYQNIGFQTVLKKQISKGVNTYEVDVFAVKSEKEGLLIECKGHHMDYLEGVDELKRHFKNRCEAAADELGWNINNLYPKVKALFVTSGGLDDAALAYAKQTKISYGIECKIMLREDLLTFLGEVDDELKKLVEAHF